MKHFLKKILRSARKHYIISAIIIIIAGIILGYVFTGGDAVTYDTVKAEVKELKQEVSVTGQVKPAESVDLGFERGGKIYRIYVNVGDQVWSGQLLATLANADSAAQVSQAKAGLESAQALQNNYQAQLDAQIAKLNELNKGATPENLQAAETIVTNAKTSVQDAEQTLENVKQKADTDLQSAYDASLTYAQSGIETGKSAIFTLTDLQYAYFGSSSQDTLNIANAKQIAVYKLLGGENAGMWVWDFISPLKGGAYAEVQTAMADTSSDNVQTALENTISALQTVKNALDVVPISGSFSTADKTSLNTAKTNVNSAITTVSSKQQTIFVQKSANQSAIATAEASLNTAKNILASAEDQLQITLAGATDEQFAVQQSAVAQAQANLDSQSAQVKYAQANVWNTSAQLGKTVIYSPIKGMITKKNFSNGEIASASSPVLSVNSQAKFQVEANIPEADIAKVEVGDKTLVTLDAYTSEDIFEAKVVAIDPAETFIEGVPAYKTTFEFLHEDERIKSGMTADMEISTDKKSAVVVIPSRAVITKDGKKRVRVLEDGKVVVEKQVQVGLRGTEGEVEIISGIDEGEEVIVFIKDNS